MQFGKNQLQAFNKLLSGKSFGYYQLVDSSIPYLHRGGYVCYLKKAFRRHNDAVIKKSHSEICAKNCPISENLVIEESFTGKRGGLRLTLVEYRKGINES
jgi:hypothetical protein